MMPNMIGGELPDQPGLRPNRACRHCVNIKAKCVPLEGGNVCTRCHRLGKECTTPAPKKRLRNSSVKPNDAQSNSSLLTPISQEELPQTTSSPRQHVPPMQCHPPQESWVPNRWNKAAGTAFEISPEIGHAFAAPVHETLFLQFRNEIAQNFPFVVIPPSSPTTIMKDRPFLYCCCVMTAAHRDPPLQSRIARDLMRYISEHMLLHGEKSLDLVQGLLLLSVWYHVYTHNQPQLMNLLHLTKALIADLGLNRAPGTGIFQLKLATDATHMVHGTDLEGKAKHNLEERRAYLAAYHIHTNYGSVFARLDPIAWTDHIDDCCSIIEKAAEYPSDVLLVALVRLDHIVERYVGSKQLRKSLPVLTYIELFSNDLDNLLSGLPAHLRSEPFVEAHILSSKISLLNPVVSSEHETIAANKIEALHFCFNTIVSFYEAFYALPDTSVPYVPFLFWVKLANAFDVLAKLSFIQFEGWDLDYVRNTPERNFPQICDRVVEKCRSVQASEEAEHPDGRSIRFKMFAARMGSFKQWYENKLEAEVKLKQAEADAAQQAAGIFNDNLDLQLHAASNEFSDMLLQDFMKDWPSLYSDMSFL